MITNEPAAGRGEFTLIAPVQEAMTDALSGLDRDAQTNGSPLPRRARRLERLWNGELRRKGPGWGRHSEAVQQDTARGVYSNRRYRPAAPPACRPVAAPSTTRRKAVPMFKKPKMRQAGLIVVAIALILIVPNLTGFIG